VGDRSPRTAGRRTADQRQSEHRTLCRLRPRGVSDEIGGFAGPLAGLHAALSRASHPLVVTAPCDSPFLPEDLVARLVSGLHTANADLAVATTFDQAHPVFCLCRREVLPHLAAFLSAGGRKIDRWYETLNVVEVNFDDEEDAFRNINTREDLGRE
jgi:molybdenum cofactor guanylyltransferase